MMGNRLKLVVRKQTVIIRGLNVRGWVPFFIRQSSIWWRRPSKGGQMGSLSSRALALDDRALQHAQRRER